MKTRNTSQTLEGCRYHGDPESCETRIRKAKKKAVAVMFCLLAVLAFAVWATGCQEHRHKHEQPQRVWETDDATITVRMTVSCEPHRHWIPPWRALPFTSHSHTDGGC